MKNPRFVWWMDDASLKKDITCEELKKIVHLMSIYFRENEIALTNLREAIEEIIDSEP